MTADAITTQPNERAQHLLRVLIQRYIQDGQPVGSRTLSKDSGLSLSPATIRNVMSDLEELGLVSAPHTSAGRIPTPQGYRMFVDTLVRYRQPGEGDIDMDAITKELRDYNFEGWIIVEDECDEAITNPDQVTLNAGAYVEKVMRPLLNN